MFKMRIQTKRSWSGFVYAAVLLGITGVGAGIAAWRGHWRLRPTITHAREGARSWLKSASRKAGNGSHRKAAHARHGTTGR